MLENRRHTRYDVSKDKIAVQMYDVEGFSFLGYIQDISRGGLQFSTDTPIQWRENQPITLYIMMPNDTRAIALDVRPIRSKRKFFHSLHAGEFVGSAQTNDLISPYLETKEQKELVSV